MNIEEVVLGVFETFTNHWFRKEDLMKSMKYSTYELNEKRYNNIIRQLVKDKVIVIRKIRNNEFIRLAEVCPSCAGLMKVFDDKIPHIRKCIKCKGTGVV